MPIGGPDRTPIDSVGKALAGREPPRAQAVPYPCFAILHSLPLNAPAKAMTVSLLLE
jgi:hypothetical protein